MNPLNTISREYVIDAILVYENVRPAALLQSQFEYNEYGATRPKTEHLIRTLHNEFPTLQFSEKYKGEYQGILVSKHNYDNKVIDMGKVLGYPCYRDYDDILVTTPLQSYTAYVVVTFKDGTTQNIMANVCKDASKLSVFKKFAKDAARVLRLPQYAQILGAGIVGVNATIVEKPTDVSITITLSGLSPGKSHILNSAEREVLQNALWNWTKDAAIMMKIHATEYNDPTHRGLVVGFMACVNNMIIIPFIPINLDPIRETAYNKITAQRSQWMAYLLNKIAKTKHRVAVPKSTHPLLKMSAQIAGKKSYDMSAIAANIQPIYGDDMATFLTTEFRKTDGFQRGLLMFMLLDIALDELAPYYSLVNTKPGLSAEIAALRAVRSTDMLYIMKHAVTATRRKKTVGKRQIALRTRQYTQRL